MDIRLEYYLENVDEFLDLIEVCGFVCEKKYLEAWTHEKSTSKIKAELLNSIYNGCKLHRESIIHTLYKLYPDDKLINYFVGINYFEKKHFKKALEHFKKAFKCNVIDEPVLLHHMILAAMFTGKRKLVEWCARKLQKYRNYREVIEVLINYHLYKGKPMIALKLLKKLEKNLSYDLYEDLKSMIVSRDYSKYYFYYPSTHYIQPYACPIRFLVESLIQNT